MSLKILIIEDDEQIAKAVQRKMELEGYDTVMALNGKEGIERYEKDTFDVVITDLIMPEQDGIETIQHIKKNHPEQAIIATSGGGLIDAKSYLDVAEKLGVSYHLEKPFKLKDLHSLVLLIKDELGK